MKDPLKTTAEFLLSAAIVATAIVAMLSLTAWLLSWAIGLLLAHGPTFGPILAALIAAAVSVMAFRFVVALKP